MCTAPWILRQLKKAPSCFLNLYWTFFANIFWLVYILANYKQRLFWQMSYQTQKGQTITERVYRIQIPYQLSQSTKIINIKVKSDVQHAVAETPCENTAQRFWFFIMNITMHLKKYKNQREQNLNWSFALGLHFVVLTLTFNHPEADVARNTSIFTFKGQQNATRLRKNYLNCWMTPTLVITWSLPTSSHIGKATKNAEQHSNYHSSFNSLFVFYYTMPTVGNKLHPPS